MSRRRNREVAALQSQPSEQSKPAVLLAVQLVPLLGVIGRRFVTDNCELRNKVGPPTENGNCLKVWRGFVRIVDSSPALEFEKATRANQPYDYCEGKGRPDAVVPEALIGQCGP